MDSYCLQCYGSCNDHNACNQDYCELRFKETGDARKSMTLNDYYEQIVKSMMEKYKQKETKMTRKEAIESVRVIYDTNRAPYERITAALEALGLIKFEEEKETFWIGDVNGCNNEHSMKMVTGALKSYGYEIVKIGQYMTVTDGNSDFSGKLVKID